VVDDEDALLHVPPAWSGDEAPRLAAHPAITRRFGDGLVTVLPGVAGIAGAHAQSPLAGGVLVADALPAQFQHRRGDRGDPRLDPAARVVVEVAALLQVVQLHQRLLGAAAEIGRLGPGLAGADVVAGDLVGA